MEFFRNQEVKWLLYAMLSILVVGMAAAYIFSPLAAVAIGITGFLLGAVFLFFTWHRYKRLALLSAYIKRVNNGEYSLELPDHDEGELSILKSEIYKVTVSLREQNERLKNEKLYMANSLSDISHQFKTPLTSLSMMTDLISNDKLDENRRMQFIGQLRAQLERLIWLTEALLKLSRLDAEAVTFRPIHVPLPELIQSACQPLLIPMELKNQAVAIKCSSDLVYCDRNWAAEALSNILKNCMEHTPPGGEICIRASANVLFTEIQIQDSGPGIDQSDLPYIFNRFYRGKETAKDSVGIGLAIAKAIAESQGGSLEAKNSSGGGAEFILRFPTV